MESVKAIGGTATPGTLREFANQSFRRVEQSEDFAPIDRVEISELAGLLHRLAELPEARARKVVSVRHQLASGTYETVDKLDLATERLLQHL
jgi:hypothetical protein